MLKKIMLLGAAIAALVAIAAPAAQAGHQWTIDGKALGEAAEVTFEGAAEFELTNGAAGAHADVVATMHLKTGTLEVGKEVGQVTQFHVSNCTGTGQLNALPCTPTTTTVNWPVTLNADTTLTIDVNLHQVYYADPGHTVPVATTILEGPVVVDLNTTTEVSSATLTGGEGLTANGSPATASGELTYTGGPGKLSICKK